MVKKNKILGILAGATLSIQTALANTGAEDAINKAGETFLGIGNTGATWVLTFAGVALFFSLIFIGMQYMFARKTDDGDKLRAVNNWLKAWVVGFIIVLVAWGAKEFFFSFG